MMPEIISQFSNLSWREPLWLLVTLIPLLLWIYSGFMRRTQLVYAETNLMPWVIVGPDNKITQRLLSKLFSKRAAYLLAWLLFSVVAAGPRLPVELGAQQQATDMDIMLVVDVIKLLPSIELLITIPAGLKIQLSGSLR